MNQQQKDRRPVALPKEVAELLTQAQELMSEDLGVRLNRVQVTEMLLRRYIQERTKPNGQT